MTIPIHVHETLRVAASPDAVAAHLRAAPESYSTTATAEALTTNEALMRSGGFRARALPTVEARLPEAGEVGTLVTRWHGDEDATGWPAMTLTTLVVAAADGTTELVFVSPRHPGVDLSTNRIDKVWRDRLARGAVRAFATSLHRLLEAATDRSSRDLHATTDTSDLVGAVRPEGTSR